MRKVLITGVTGFLGQALVSALHDRAGIALFGYSRDLVRANVIFKDYNIDVIEDVGADKLNELQIQTVIHLAGIAHDLNNKYTAQDYFLVNDKATRDLYDEFLKSTAKKFIFLSSIKAAIDIASSPVAEDVLPSPASPYGQSKLNAERYLQKKAARGKSVYILRPCMVHGPGNKGNLNLLYRYVRTGLPFPLGSFHNQRSFLGIDNFTFIVDRLINESVPPGIYHLADDEGISTADLVRLIATTNGMTASIINIPKGLMKVAFRVLARSRMLDKLTEDMLVSNRKIKGYLGGPLPLTMREGLVRTIKSFDEN